MPRFHPYSIHHLSFDGIENVSLPAGNHYIVLWNGKIPLGHFWLETRKKPVSLGDYREELAAVAEPALEALKALKALRGGGTGNGNSKLSVVICTRNRPVDLERCLQRLLSSSDKDFELIVVDNAPDDEASERVVAKFPSVRYVREERKGLDIARNTGARAAGGDIIAYTDDDVVVDEDWTANIKGCFDDSLVMAVTGLVIPAQLRTRSQYIFERYWSFNKGYLPKIFDHRYFLDNLPWGVPVWDIGAGANMAFRREAFELAGWFDERLDVGASGCSGDSEFWYRILAEGWNCRYFPHLVVYHHHRETMDGLRSQLFYYMRGHVSALLVQYERYGHEGNRWRIRWGLPKYFLKRIRDAALFRNRQARENSGRLLSEIRGCISGWRYYLNHRARGESKVQKGLKTQGHSQDQWGAKIYQGGSKAQVGSKDHQGGAKAREAPKPFVLPIPQRLKEDAVVTEDTLVSVVIPCYNYAHYLEAAIVSVLEQSYQGTEIIVVDDGSTDGTELACSRYEKVRYVRVERVGVSAARNIGVRFSRGDFVVFLDADDLLYPNAIELNLFYFTLYKKLAYVSGGHDRIDEQGNYLKGHEAVVKAGDNYWALLQGNYIAMEATVMYRRELFFRWHFDASLSACEDYDLNLQIARDLPVFGHSAKIAAYRIHGGNASGNGKIMAAAALAVLKKQENLLQNEEEMSAYHSGMENWQKYYDNNAENETILA
jgi:glycosyltransferase involved in cell wall biosynthesis